MMAGCLVVMVGSWEGAGSWERGARGGGGGGMSVLQTLDTCCLHGDKRYILIRYQMY